MREEGGGRYVVAAEVGGSVVLQLDTRPDWRLPGHYRAVLRAQTTHRSGLLITVIRTGQGSSGGEL